MARYCTGSTEAWTELVESATERRTLSAIQSSKKSLRIWNAPNAGSERIVYPHTCQLCALLPWMWGLTRSRIT